MLHFDDSLLLCLSEAVNAVYNGFMKLFHKKQLLLCGVFGPWMYKENLTCCWKQGPILLPGIKLILHIHGAHRDINLASYHNDCMQTNSQGRGNITLDLACIAFYTLWEIIYQGLVKCPYLEVDLQNSLSHCEYTGRLFFGPIGIIWRMLNL